MKSPVTGTTRSLYWGEIVASCGTCRGVLLLRMDQKEQVEGRGMSVRQLPDLALNGQHWLKIGRSQDAVNTGYRFQTNG